MKNLHALGVALFFCLFGIYPEIYSRSVSEDSPYPLICQQAADNDETFANFKRHPHYRAILEHVTYEEGLEYLLVIREEYPEMLNHLDRFRENDLLGNPYVYNYGSFGSFSPTTLRYIKVAGDLNKRFGDQLSRMHIVEIGGGYGGQCKILSDLCGFASYTIIDLPSASALSKKYLDRLGVKNVYFLNNAELQLNKPYDLVISNYAFSELEGNEQVDYLDEIISATPYGYMTMNYMEPFNQRFTNEELISIFCSYKRQGKFTPEKPITAGPNQIFTWEPAGEKPLSNLKEKIDFDRQKFLTGKKNALSYTFSGGQLGDNLIAYFHAKWLSLKYQLPLVYNGFPHADFLKLSEMDLSSADYSFDNMYWIQKESQIPSAPPLFTHANPLLSRKRI